MEKKKKKIIKSEDYIININGEGLKEFIERNRNEEVLKCIFEPDHKADWFDSKFISL